MSSKNRKMGIYTSISFSAIIRKIVNQAGCFENTRDFPSKEIPLGYRLRSPLLSSRNHARSALLTVFSITHPDLFYNADLEMLTAFILIIDRSKGYKYNRSQPGKDEIYQKEQ